MNSNLLVWKMKLSLLAGAAVMAGIAAKHDEPLQAAAEQPAFTTKVSRHVPAPKAPAHPAPATKRASFRAWAADL